MERNLDMTYEKPSSKDYSCPNFSVNYSTDNTPGPGLASTLAARGEPPPFSPVFCGMNYSLYALLGLVGLAACNSPSSTSTTAG
jgi:hypothetical protein